MTAHDQFVVQCHEELCLKLFGVRILHFKLTLVTTTTKISLLPTIQKEHGLLPISHLFIFSFLSKNQYNH